MTVLGAVAGMFLKKASSKLEIKSLVFNYNLYLGAFLYFLSAIINIYVLKFLDYSKALPLTSITYVWGLIISFLVFKEKVGIKKFVGIFLITLGATIQAL